MNDPIVEEVRRLREEHAARFNYGVDAIFEDLRKRQKEMDRPLVSLPARRLAKAGDSRGRSEGPGSRP
jgi:hypothetical protein